MSIDFCNSTGLWTGITLQDQANFSSGKTEEIYISHRDKNILRDKAKKMLEISKLDEQEKKKALWYEHNELKTKMPVIFVDPENGWNEIILENQLKCEGILAKRWELVLSKEIFWGEHIKDDKPIEPNFYIGYTFYETDWGISGKFHGGKNGGSYTWDSVITKQSDIKKLNFKRIILDYKTTLKTFELARSVFD